MPLLLVKTSVCAALPGEVRGGSVVTQEEAPASVVYIFSRIKSKSAV